MISALTESVRVAEYRTNKLLVKKQERDLEQLRTDLEDAKSSGGGGGFAEQELEEVKKQLVSEYVRVCFFR